MQAEIVFFPGRDADIGRAGNKAAALGKQCGGPLKTQPRRLRHHSHGLDSAAGISGLRAGRPEGRQEQRQIAEIDIAVAIDIAGQI
ncbi:MAG: hypothetical protein AMXMBFR47_02190 [Planctomycetota bacterium]